MNTLKMASVLLVLGSAAAVGCSKSSSEAPAAAASEGGEATPAPSGALSDAQIAQVMATVDSGEIEQAKLAVSKATDARVRNFAQNMIDQHTQSKLEGQEVASQNGIAPTSSSDALQLQNDAKNTLEQLKQADAPSFDQAYMRAQVKQHQEVLALITNKLLPEAKTPALTDLLTKARGMVQHHLDQARQIEM